jgi:hypothetical protein
MRSATLAVLIGLIATPAVAAGNWLVASNSGGAFGYDSASVATDKDGHKQVTAGFYTKQAVNVGGKMANFIVEDAKIDCAGGKIYVTTYNTFDDSQAPLASAPGGQWHDIAGEPLLAMIKPAVCDSKPLDGTKPAGDLYEAMRTMKALGSP